MTTLRVTLVVLQGVIFVIWAVMVFRTLFTLRARHEDETGRPWIGPIAVWGVFARFLKEPAHGTERRRLGWATLALIVATVLLAIPTPP